ncbi:MetQ/NlpA family ABC transporter substrate-binding protein [Olsenella sp. YH-ols2217]|uniref:Lipoprotein n=1 Tax=Kribbibacterium absianum TaxID=3044210 RepID=A0ABT6ZKA0_9ACTN|nr:MULTISPECIES: MetQ/NlpA family ABC transporter substrate-binding protein [unclassified Olsenella]MDJ1122574.1 MetQ/NlpA family ABC transporter substrate-binding protein [Olsenella sp. YH-ols2216]MDJ1129466.1 MetQ/NlpA family ABC transporter substrate-binding protein [Olsenella sp. YH-ols2217]
MKNLYIERRGALALALTALAAPLVGCGSSDSTADATTGASASSGDTTITVGASPTPHAEILNAVKDELAKDGYTLKVVEYNDYVLPNTALEDGELDANYFQHITYLNDFNEENGTHLASAGAIHFEPFGLYAGKTSSLDDLADGATVAVPNDTTNEARALLLLEQEGLITLKDGAGLNATVVDIEDNPKNLQIEEVEAAQLPRVLQDVDLAAINGNYALGAGLNVSDALAVESDEGEAAKAYGNVIAVKEGNEDSEKTKALVKALTSDTCKQYIEDTYDGAVVPLF